ncbi:hypothetical protein [Amycolatopsis solani]|uniref:hypothetical protein n=1 Tax=Amycolatopsis solani TaxID=3028615 RepID=UPI0025AF3605|nr:hypothetical protein [Amycolatopsis sp. MEP2-6]
MAVAQVLQIVQPREQSGDRALLLSVLLSAMSVPASATVSHANIRDLTVAWPSEQDSAQPTKVLRSAIAQQDAVQAAGIATNELLGAMVAAVAAGLHPGEFEDFR